VDEPYDQCAVGWARRADDRDRRRRRHLRHRRLGWRRHLLQRRLDEHRRRCGRTRGKVTGTRWVLKRHSSGYSIDGVQRFWVGRLGAGARVSVCVCVDLCAAYVGIALARRSIVCACVCGRATVSLFVCASALCSPMARRGAAVSKAWYAYAFCVFFIGRLPW
jgi:hypothetical protein